MKTISLSRRQAAFIGMICCLVYFTSYLTRINYTAVLLEIAQSLHLSNQLAGMAVIGLFITYGAGQPICGYLGDRFEPRAMIFIGLVATAVCNLAIAFMNNIYWMTFVWCLNGFFQAMLWPPLVRFMTRYLSPELYRKAIVGIVAASSTGTITVYLLVPFSIWISSWRLSFIIPGIAAFLVAFIWLYSVRGFAVKQDSKDSQEDKRSEPSTTRQPRVGSLIMLSGLLPIMLVIILQGALRDGITTWIPTYMNDVFQFGSSVSILSAAVLPLFTILFVHIAAQIYKRVSNELTVSAILWGAGLVAGSVLIWTFASQAMISVVLMALLTGCMHGINLMLISNLPLHFAKYGRASTMSGILNAFTYVGSAISIYGIAALSEAYGWRVTIICWTIIAFVGLVFCISRMKQWRSFTDLT